MCSVDINGGENGKIMRWRESLGHVDMRSKGKDAFGYRREGMEERSTDWKGLNIEVCVDSKAGFVDWKDVDKE